MGATRIRTWGQTPTDSKKQLTVERLVDAITLATRDRDMQERAVRLGERIRAEDGITRARVLLTTIYMRVHDIRHA